MLKIFTLTLVTLAIAASITGNSLAAKPDKEMKQQTKGLAKEQKVLKKMAKPEQKMQQKADKEKSGDKVTGMEKQREKKSTQEMKELGKGSEQGQTQREEVRKKWWKFWD